MKEQNEMSVIPQTSIGNSYHIGDIIKTRKWTARVIMSAGEVIALAYMDGTFFTIMTPKEISDLTGKDCVNPITVMLVAIAIAFLGLIVVVALLFFK
jgi:hypothetical protein